MRACRNDRQLHFFIRPKDRIQSSKEGIKVLKKESSKGRKKVLRTDTYWRIQDFSKGGGGGPRKTIHDCLHY